MMIWRLIFRNWKFDEAYDWWNEQTQGIMIQASLYLQTIAQFFCLQKKKGVKLNDINEQALHLLSLCYSLFRYNLGFICF